MHGIGILCASDTELAPFLQNMREVHITEKAMLHFHDGLIRETAVVALYSGVCKVNAAIAAQILIDFFHVKAIINAGCAGGIDERVQLFDTVVTERAVYHDVADDILTEFHPWVETNCFPASDKLLDIVKKYSASVVHPILFGTTVTGEQFIEDDGREKIWREFAPLSVDMETASAAHVCHVNRIPFVAIRTITDTAAHAGIANFEERCETASEISAGIVMDLLSVIDREI